MADLSITCPVCGMTSYHPGDVEEGYCGNCRDWTTDLDRDAKEFAGTHGCCTTDHA